MDLSRTSKEKNQKNKIKHKTKKKKTKEKDQKNKIKHKTKKKKTKEKDQNKKNKINLSQGLLYSQKS